MIRVIVLLSLFCYSLSAGTCEAPRHVSGNFAYDIEGVADNRPGTWGRAGADYRTLRFNRVPAGKRVRILGITGDLTARWVRRGSYVSPGQYTGVLAAVHTANSSGSAHADLAADGHFVYVQGDIIDGGVVVKFDETFAPNDPGAVLPTPELVFKVAKYLDETPFWTHFEITFSNLAFCYETP